MQNAKNGKDEMKVLRECDNCSIEMPIVNELADALANRIEGGVFTDVDAEGNEDAICIFCEDMASGSDNVVAYILKWGVDEFDKRFGWQHAGNVPEEYRKSVK